MTNEIWKTIPIEPWCDRYEVSNLGRIRQSPIIIPQYEEPKGYRRVPLSARGVKASVAVHRLVAAAFIRLPDAKEVANHLNSQRNDNRAENLEWTTYSGNSKHCRENLGHIPHGIRKLIPEIVFLKYKEGQTITEIAKDFTVSPQTVSQMLSRYNMRDNETIVADIITKEKSSTASKGIDFEEAKRMRVSGRTMAEIGKKFNWTPEGIGHLFKRNGFSFVRDRVRQETKDKIIKMRKEGKGICDIGIATHSNNRTVRRILTDAGIK